MILFIIRKKNWYRTTKKKKDKIRKEIDVVQQKKINKKQCYKVHEFEREINSIFINQSMIKSWIKLNEDYKVRCYLFIFLRKITQI